MILKSSYEALWKDLELIYGCPHAIRRHALKIKLEE